MDRDILATVDLFRELPDSARETMATILKCRTFRRGDVLFNEGEPGEGIWILSRGAVRLIKSDSEGRERLLKIVRPGEVFAEVVLFDGGDYPATAIAADAGCATVIYNRDAEELMRQHPGLAWHFLRALSRRLRDAYDRMHIISASDVVTKLAGLLLQLSREQGKLVISISQQDLADMLGTARETISRSLGVLADQRLVTVRRNRIEILDAEELQVWGRS
ncbi:MAG TPA: Crp/Fnr family transcriptional regulator [Bacillota bacterium]|nr:Crp/Fnr family transcriptional regulator [Bacillota bacterium]